MARTVPLSARVSEADADFIASLEIDGAKTPSDKLRAIIAEARQRQRGHQDYAGALAMMGDLLAPAMRRVRQAEHQEGIHSELLSRVGEWLPEAMAYLVAEGPSAANATEGLSELERGMADRVFTLMESMLQMGVTRRCPCYDQAVVSQRLEPVLDLARVILEQQPKTKKR